MQKNLLINLHPPRSPLLDLDAGKGDFFHPTVSSNSPLVLPESTRSSFADAQSYVADIEAEKICGGDVSVCPLGTNSAMPSKYRNGGFRLPSAHNIHTHVFLVSATLIHIPNCGYVLLDTGEGTWGQLARKFGDGLMSTSSVWQVLRQLKCIFISHMHADHHIGLAKILAMRQRVSIWTRDIEPHELNVRQLDPPSNTPLYIIGHDNVFMYLQEYAALEELGLLPNSRSPVISISVDAIHWKNDFSSPWLQEVSRRYACTESYLHFPESYS